MLYLTAETQILLAIKPVDFRKQIDGLVALCDHKLEQESRSGHLFVFINRAHTMIRVLCYKTNGYWLSTKRLSRGRYTLWPKKNETVCLFTSCELTKILQAFVANTPDSV